MPARRSITRLLSLTAGCFMVAAGACTPPAGTQSNLTLFTIPRDAARFAIGSTTDSTITFRQIEATWVKPGLSGHVVDPLQRDALVARVTIRRSDSTGMIAVIDGAVAPVTTGHIVLFAKPSVRWWRDKRFWTGAAAGIISGAVISNASK